MSRLSNVNSWVASAGDSGSRTFSETICPWLRRVFVVSRPLSVRLMTRNRLSSGATITSTNPRATRRFNTPFSVRIDSLELSNNLSFINNIPHISFVWGAENVAFLKARYTALQVHPLFADMEYSEDPANCAIRVSPQTRRFMDTVYQRVFEPPSILSEHLQWQYSQLDNCWKTATGSIFQPDETFMKATTCTFTVTKTAYLSEIMVHHDRYHDLAEILKAMGAAEVHIPEYMDEKSLFDPDTIAANRRSCPGTGKVKISKADLSTINLKRYAKGQSWLDKLEEV